MEKVSKSSSDTTLYKTREFNFNSHGFFFSRKVYMSNACVFLLFFSLFHLIILNFVNSKCPGNFQCASLGILEFPLSNYSQPECGFLRVDCNASSPKLYLANEELSSPYDILSKISTNVFSIRNPTLLGYLRYKFCDLPYINFSLPNSPSISFTIFPNITLFRCIKSNDTQKRYFQGFRNYSGCESFDIYYTTTENLLSPPNGCSAVPVPVYSQYDPNTTDFWDLFTDQYNLEWHLSDDCSECHKKGGQCATDNVSTFLCQQGVPAAATLVLFFVILFTLNKRNCALNLKGKTQNDKDIEEFLKNHGDRIPRRYKHSDLKKMTSSFCDNLGEGGFGVVYRGKLQDGCLVAVKILKESKGNGQEFINEVASISRTSHVNIVSLRGFCFEGSKRALIYEFMQNGSLDKFIGNNNYLPEGQLGWEKLLKIAVGIARGIEYLHQGCNTRILHFDIKPHNILLDKDFNPKISDFGLAKLCPNRSSTVSMLVARGTIGYIAPELVCRTLGEVSYKSDVYSYGMMVLEMVGETKNFDVNSDRSSEIYFPHWIYKHLEQNSQFDINRIANEDEHLMIRKMIIVGLWCIQNDPTIRPSMTRVLEMLEGNIESLQIPPKPFISSPKRLAANFSTSELAIGFADVSRF
ncbi:Protein kinase superfamily protein [Forsythia ovata]